MHVPRSLLCPFAHSIAYRCVRGGDGRQDGVRLLASHNLYVLSEAGTSLLVPVQLITAIKVSRASLTSL